MVVDPASGRPHLYDALTDPLQRHDISAEHPGIATSLRQRAEAERQLTDYLLETNRVWPDSLQRDSATDLKRALSSDQASPVSE
jgi:hypothetical protein